MGDIYDATGGNIDLNHIKSDILSDVIEEYRLDFEDTRYGKGDLSNNRDFPHKKLISMRGQNLQLVSITEKQPWYAPIICYQK